jgi:hypothetical protein
MEFGFFAPSFYFETNRGEEWALLLLGNKLSRDFLFCGAKTQLGHRSPHCVEVSTSHTIRHTLKNVTHL